MNQRLRNVFFLFFCFLYLNANDLETLPVLKKEEIPQTYSEMWRGFDPRVEPLETEILKEWTQDGVVLRVLRYRIDFKRQKA